MTNRAVPSAARHRWYLGNSQSPSEFAFQLPREKKRWQAS